MKIIALSFVFLALSFTLCIAKDEKNETQGNNNKSGPFDIQEVCKASNDAVKCASILKSLGGNNEKVKMSETRCFPAHAREGNDLKTVIIFDTIVL